MNVGKGLIEETHPQFIGIYNGAASKEYVQRRIEEADCVLSIGTLMANFNTGKFSAKLDPGRTIEVQQQSVKVKRALYNFVGQVLWGSIGYSVGALLGCAIAAPQRQSILLVGDGSFQIAAQELSTMLHYNLQPIIFLINNDGYTIERDIHGEKMPYNDIQRWNYHKLHEIFSSNGWGIKVSTESELETALQKVEQNLDKLAFIEVVMSKMDNPKVLLKMMQQ